MRVKRYTFVQRNYEFRYSDNDHRSITLWVDLEGQVRRKDMDETLEVGGNRTYIDTTIIYSDFGVPNEITAPVSRP